MPALPPERPGCPKVPGGRRPLPDPAAVRLCLVPDSAPPYDDEVPAAGPPGRGGAGESRPAGGDRPLDQRRPAGGDRPLDERRPADRGRTGKSAAAIGWQSRFAQALAETLAGSRPPRQIVPWTTQQAREHIRRLGPRMASVQRPRVRRVVTFRPASDVVEMAVVVGFGPRVRALAVRLEWSAACPPAGLGKSPGRGEPSGRGERAGRWVCTAVEAA